VTDDHRIDTEQAALLERVLAERAALRRVATLVARETPPDVVLAAVAREAGEMLGVDGTRLGRFEGDAVVSVAEWGARLPLDGNSISAQIAVDGRPWGVMVASSRTADPFPPDAEARLQDFTELVAAAISNAGAHDRARVLAEEQAALRRVATLVAQEKPQGEVFGAIAEEMARLLGIDGAGMLRYEEDCGVVVSIAGPIAEIVPVGLRMPIEGFSVGAMVQRTGASARIDDYTQDTGPWADRMTAAGLRSVVGSPIIVAGHLWGSMMAITNSLPLPPDTEARMGQFTELMAIAIANAEARTELARLAEEQAALRRVATLVAEGASPSAVFDAVTAEVAQVVGCSAVSLGRYEDGQLVVLATHGMPDVDIGDRFEIGETARAAGARSTVGAPIVVDGRTWGVLAAVWSDHGTPPDDTEERLARFTRLLETAIANADSRDQLTASRARVLAAGDEARRRVVRDLHDGAQQRLVQTIVTLKLARQDPEHADELTAEALGIAERAMVELRELAHGILPAVLTRGGLRAGIAGFVARLDLPVELELTDERLNRDLEASAYFIVAEALTNVVKHAGATRATVRAVVEGDVLAIEVTDDGAGGADPEGHGLLGIADRVGAHGGSLRIESEAGTVISARLPLSR
jgi:signal transduction histidine kinase